MSYANRDDIASEFKRLSFTGNDPVISESEVDKFIEEAEALINSFVCVRYNVPVLGVQSVLILKKITIDFVSFRVEKILRIKNPSISLRGDSSKGFEQSSMRAQAYEESKNLLSLIRDAKAKLPDAIAINENPQVGFGVHYSANGQIQSPIFERYKEQW